MTNLMNEILTELFKNGKINESLCREVDYKEDENGNVTITYKNPKKSDTYKEIKNFIENIDDDLFMIATENMNKDDHNSYAAMAKQLDELTDIRELSRTFDLFKGYVKKAAEDKIESLQKMIIDLHREYIKD